MSNPANNLREQIGAYLDGRLNDDEVAELSAAMRRDESAQNVYLELADLHSCLAVDESLWSNERSAPAPANKQRFLPHRLQWAAFVAGLLIASVSVGLAWAASLPERSEATVVTELTHGDFEAPTPLVAGVPYEAGVWGGDQSEIVGRQQGIVPGNGHGMLRFVSSNHLGGASLRTYCSDVFQVIDVQHVMGRRTGKSASFRLSASFNAVPSRSEAEFGFAVQLLALSQRPRDPTDSGSWTWLERNNLARSRIGIDADADLATWQQLEVTLTAPSETKFLVLHVVVLQKNASPNTDVVHFKGHYVDDVKLVSQAIEIQRRIRGAE